MSTRCLTVFVNKEKEVAVMYRHSDGYLEGHGKELADYLSGKKIINGFKGNEDLSKVFNGYGCLVASVIAHFKDGPGEIYIHPAGTRDIWEEYIYTVRGNVGEEPTIHVEDFNGRASDFNDWLEKQYSAEED